VYVVPAAREAGLGRRSPSALIAAARAKGYGSLRLDATVQHGAGNGALPRPRLCRNSPYGPDHDGEIAFFRKSTIGVKAGGYSSHPHEGGRDALLIAMMKHEPTLLAGADPIGALRHGPGRCPEAAVKRVSRHGVGARAYLDLAEREKAEIVLPIAAGARRAAGGRRGIRAHGKRDL